MSTTASKIEEIERVGLSVRIGEKIYHYDMSLCGAKTMTDIGDALRFLLNKANIEMEKDFK